LVSLALLLALTFWPSGDSEGSYGNPEPPRSSARSSASNDRLVRISQGTPRPT
jgi:hypothetical protein